MSPTKSKKHKLPLVGFGKKDITPPLPFPMAGLAGKKERLADKVRDPLYARALAFSDKAKTAVIVSVDLLMITFDLRTAVENLLDKENVKIDGLMISATHSHSAMGGFMNKPSAKLFMGAYRPELFNLLVEGITCAVKEALEDLQPAELHFGEVQTEGLNYNRRHAKGPIDRTIGSLRIKRKGKDIQVVSFGAHPVVVAFREYATASADYPGQVIRKIEEDGTEGMFLVGPVGGVNVFFPEGPMDLEFHITLLARLLMEQVEAADLNAKPFTEHFVGFGLAETGVEVVFPRLFPDTKYWADVLLAPLRLWVYRFGKGGMEQGHKALVPVLRLGDLIFTGFPADLGAGVGLAARKKIEDAGCRCVVVASQTGDYVGYVHLPPEYQQFETEDKSALWMNIYENAMGFGGRNMGIKLLDAFEKAYASAFEKNN